VAHSNLDGVVALYKSDINAIIDALEKEVTPSLFIKLSGFLMPTLNVNVMDEEGNALPYLCAVYVHRLNGFYATLASSVPLRTRRALPRIRPTQ